MLDNWPVDGRSLWLTQHCIFLIHNSHWVLLILRRNINFNVFWMRLQLCSRQWILCVFIYWGGGVLKIFRSKLIWYISQTSHFAFSNIKGFGKTYQKKKRFFILNWYTFHIFQIFIIVYYSKIFKVELLIIPQYSCF